MGKEKETALPKNIRQIGEIRGAEKICIEDYVMTCIHKKAGKGWLSRNFLWRTAEGGRRDISVPPRDSGNSGR